MQENIIISPRRGGVIVGTWNKKLSFIGLTLSGWAISDELYRGDNKILSGWQQNPVGVTQYWNSIGVCWAIGIQFGVVLEGFRGLNDFFIRLGVTTEFCRGDKNDPNVFGVHPDPSGCNPEQPRATPSNPDRGSDEGCNVVSTKCFTRTYFPVGCTKNTVFLFFKRNAFNRYESFSDQS